MKKHIAPQFEIAIKNEPFALVGEKLPPAPEKKAETKPDTETMEMFEHENNSNG